MSETIEEKLNKMNLAGYSQRDLDTIADWKRNLMDLRVDEDYLNHPTSKKLAEIARQEILRIEEILKNNEDIPEVERKALFREKKAHKIYYDFLNRNVSQIKQQLETDISNSL